MAPSNGQETTRVALGGFPPLDRGADARYETIGVLGKGGMGTVLLCRDGTIGRQVAKKVINKESLGDEETRTRFVAEARIQGQLEHPSLVPVHDLAVDADGAAYFTMKRVRGVTLEEIVHGLVQDRPGFREKYSSRRILSDFSRVCLAVDFAHQHGVLHRDLKPANIMLGDFGEVYVVDWGIAKVMQPDEQPRDAPGTPEPDDFGPETVAGQRLGTLGYMSPEQLKDDSAVLTPRSDVYSLGAILFEILTMKCMHHQTTRREQIRSTLVGVDGAPSTRAPERKIAPELDEICLRATALNPEDRYASARELQIALERFLSGERDEELRKELARRHADAAVTAIAEATSIEQRRAAMREIGRALALDPENAGALGAMVRLLGDPPDEMPEEVRAEMRSSWEQQMRWVAKVATVAYFSMLIYVPLIMWQGLRSATALLPWLGLCMVCAVGTLLVARSKKPRIEYVLTMNVISTVAMAGTMVFYGPLLLMPAIVAANSVAYAMSLEGRARLASIIVGCLGIVVPVVLQGVGVLPETYRFSEAGMTVVPWAVDLGRLSTTVFFVLISLSNLITACVSVSRVRDNLTRAEQKLYMHDWHIRQFLPTSPEKS